MATHRLRNQGTSLVGVIWKCWTFVDSQYNLGLALVRGSSTRITYFLAQLADFTVRSAIGSRQISTLLLAYLFHP